MNLQEKLSTFVLTAGEHENAKLCVDALGYSHPGARYIVSNGYFGEHVPDGWGLIEFNDNYGIGAMLNITVKLGAEYVLILEEDWFLCPDVPGNWLELAIETMERYSFDVLKMRRHYSQDEAAFYGTHDWTLSQYAADFSGFRKTRERKPGPWLMENTPHIRRNSAFVGIKPFAEFNDGVYRDAWKKYGYPKEEYAINEFNDRQESQKMKFGVIFPGLFVHERPGCKPKAGENVTELACAMSDCVYGFMASVKDKNSWCIGCSKEHCSKFGADNVIARIKMAEDMQVINQDELTPEPVQVETPAQEIVEQENTEQEIVEQEDAAQESEQRMNAAAAEAVAKAVVEAVEAKKDDVPPPPPPEEKKPEPAWRVIRIVTFGVPDEVAKNLPFNVRIGNCDNWRRELSEHTPDVIVTCGESYDNRLNSMEAHWGMHWVHVDQPEKITNAVVATYTTNLYREPLNPLVSVYTGCHNTSRNFVYECYNSIAWNSYVNWEWVVVVDTPENEETMTALREVARNDSRVRLFTTPYSGRIGAVKDFATRLCRGDYVLELDHDDLLLPGAIWEVVQAFQDPLVGFVYSDNAEIDGAGNNLTYERDGYWKDRYRDEEFNGKMYRIANCFDIYDGWGWYHWQRHAWYLTVGPNHLRAYRRSKLMELGGYNPNLAVSDDWDIMAKFYLRSCCYHIPKFLYIQRFQGTNTQRRPEWNALIQYNLALARAHYNNEFEQFVKEQQWTPAKHIGWPDSLPKLLTIVIATYMGCDRLKQLLPELKHAKVAIKVISDGHDPDCKKTVLDTAKECGIDDIQYLFIAPQKKPAWGHAQRAYAISNCDTPYVWFVDDDNVVYGGAIDKIINKLEETSPDILFADIDYDGSKVGLPLKEIVLRALDDVRFQHVDTMSFVFRKELHQWKDTGYTGDWTFINECKEKASKVAFLGEKVGSYKRNAS